MPGVSLIDQSPFPFTTTKVTKDVTKTTSCDEQFFHRFFVTLLNFVTFVIGIVAPD